MRYLIGLATLVATTCTILADEIALSSKQADRQVCSGIYSKKDWNGPYDSFIDVALSPKDADKHGDGWIAMIIFDYRNVELIGVSDPATGNKKFVCDDLAVSAGLCESEQQGTFILQDGANSTEFGPVVTKRINVNNPEAIHYPVVKTGFYCVSTYPSDAKLAYNGAAVYQNAFGKLPASQVPKLSFFGGAAIAYLLVLCFWMFSYVQNRSDILPVQNYITAICGFLVIEMVCIWGYYDYVNNNGEGTGQIIFLGFLSILNSFRNAFTFFLLLIVCLGYGVVVPSLGDVMWKCRALALAHLIFALIYTVTTYISVPEDASIWVLLCIVPLALTMTTFYVWILSSLTFTIKSLEDKKQNVKARMYKLLWRILLGSIIVIFVFFFINSMIFSQESTLDFITNHWKSRWFLFDGWLNVIYFVDFVAISFIWRPNSNNRRFAMSTELAQDENDVQEFEIDSFDIDEEDAIGIDSRRHSREGNPFDDSHEVSPRGDHPVTDSSENNETMFAVEDDDGDYEHDSGDDNRRENEDESMLNKSSTKKKDDTKNK